MDLIFSPDRAAGMNNRGFFGAVPMLIYLLFDPISLINPATVKYDGYK